MTGVNAFVANDNVEKTQQILKLSQHDSKMLVDALDAPAKVHTRLQQAVHRYNNKTQS